MRGVIVLTGVRWALLAAFWAVLSGCSSAEAPGATSCGSSCSVPTGRPESVACPATDVSAEEPAGNSTTMAACSTDADCGTATLSGHCLNGQCGPDQCLSDSDCPSGQACGCATQFAGNAFHTNRCVPSNCRVDSDCGENGFCSDTSSGYCGSFSGFYCHTPADQCHTDADCSSVSTPTCSYQPMLGYWACQAHSVCTG
jgi:hypothetical protein